MNNQPDYISRLASAMLLNMDIEALDQQIAEKNNLQNNLLNTIEIYDILSPILKEKYVIVKILDMKCDMETCKLRQDKILLEKKKADRLKETQQLMNQQANDN